MKARDFQGATESFRRAVEVADTPPDKELVELVERAARGPAGDGRLH